MVTRSVRATRPRCIGEARRLAWAFRQEASQVVPEWEDIWANFDAIAARVDAYDQDLSLADLEQSEQMLRASLFAVGGTEIDWARIQLEAQFSGLHIEEL